MYDACEKLKIQYFVLKYLTWDRSAAAGAALNQKTMGKSIVLDS